MKVAIASKTPWFWDALDSRGIEAETLRIRDPSELTIDALRAFQPRLVFFPHWSERVPAAVFNEFECICFHAAPVPYGRGGSPVQNMIAQGHQVTQVSALRMVEDLDAGPVYMRRSVSLLGGGEEIFMRINATVLEMINDCIRSMPTAQPQVGESVFFKRRRPEQSRISEESSIAELFDHIRMLDVTGYPHAFLEFGGFRMEFTRPALTLEGIKCDVVIRNKVRK